MFIFNLPNILEENVKIIFCLIFNLLIICVLIRKIFLKRIFKNILNNRQKPGKVCKILVFLLTFGKVFV